MNIRNVAFGLMLLTGLTFAQEAATRVGGSGTIVSLDTGKRELVLALKQADGTTTNTPFTVSENCQIITGSLGVLSDLKAGQFVKLDYTKADSGALTAESITYTPPAKPATKPTTTPAKKPAPKKAPAKKPAPKKK